MTSTLLSTASPQILPLTRPALLTAALRGLDGARATELRVAAALDARGPSTARTHTLERLAAQRELVARRAANVALAATVAADELGELRDATHRLAVVAAWAGRDLSAASGRAAPTPRR